jgi:hypothetical protein
VEIVLLSLLASRHHLRISLRLLTPSAAPATAGRNRVYVHNLDWDVTWQILKDHMRTAGEVVRADVFTKPSGQSRGNGIVEYATPAEAQAAINTLNDTMLMDRQIIVREVRACVYRFCLLRHACSCIVVMSCWLLCRTSRVPMRPTKSQPPLLAVVLLAGLLLAANRSELRHSLAFMSAT